LIKEQKVNQTNKLDINGMEAGVYFIEFESEGMKTNQKFIKK